MTTMAGGCWAMNGRNRPRGSLSPVALRNQVGPRPGYQRRLCDVDRDASIVPHDGLLLLPRQQRLWHIDADSVAGGAHLINPADEVRAIAQVVAAALAADLGFGRTAEGGTMTPESAPAVT